MRNVPLTGRDMAVHGSGRFSEAPVSDADFLGVLEVHDMLRFAGKVAGSRPSRTPVLSSRLFPDLTA